MRYRRQMLLAATMGVLAVGLPHWAAAQTAPSNASAQPAPSNPVGVNDVVVTARRRQETLQTVPLSITALGAQDLVKKDIHTGADLQHAVPSLNINTAFGGETGYISIRGQGTTYTGTIANPGVTSYFADVPTPGGLVSPSLYFDLRNIQVLKGPQGTLFGRNSLGGAVLFEPNRPGDQFGGYIQGTYGNYNRQGLEGAVNIPIIPDTLSARVAAVYGHRDGYVTDPLSGGKYDDQNYWSARLSILWRPTDRIENYLIASSMDSYDHGEAYALSFVNDNSQLIQGYNAALGILGLPTMDDIVAAQKARGPYSVAMNSQPSGRTHTDVVQDTLTFRINDEFTVKNIASFSHLQQIFAREDYDGTPYPYFDTAPFPSNLRLPAPGGGTMGLPLPVDKNGDYINQDTVTEELQLQGQLFEKALDFTLGFYIQKDTPESYGGNNLEEFQLPGEHGGTALSETETTNESKSVYGQGTFNFAKLSDSLKGLRLTLGYRHTWDDTRGSTESFTLANNGDFGTLFGAPLGANGTCTSAPPTNPPYDCLSSISQGFQADTWNVSVDYQLTPSKLIYIASRHGYKAGGVNNTAPGVLQTYSPETITDIEAGLKADWRLSDDVRLRTDLAIYHSWQNGIQEVENVTANGENVSPVISGSIGHSTGLELEATLTAFDKIELSGFYNYNRFDYDRYVGTDYDWGDAAHLANNISCAPGDPGFQTFSPGGTTGTCYSKIHPNAPYTPEHKFNVSARYHFLGTKNADGDISVAATYTWQSRSTGGIPTLGNADLIPAYGLLNLNLDWDRIMGSHVSASLFATNVTNQQYVVGEFTVSTTLGIVTKVYGEPSMYGVRLRYDW